MQGVCAQSSGALCPAQPCELECEEMVDLLFRVFYESDCAQAGSVCASGLETCSSLKSRICEASCPELTACDTVRPRLSWCTS